MDAPRIVRELKRDALGHVELIELPGDDGPLLCVRRVAAGRLGLRAVARALAARERRALSVLQGLDGVGGLADPEPAARLADARGRVPRPAEVTVRKYVEGVPLHRAEALPRDYFDLLEQLVEALHARGVCHNDLHKEQNVLVRPDGRPALIDFQLASVHAARGRRFRSRVHDDLRHVQKHRRRYTRDGRGPSELRVADDERLPRSPVARLWRRTGKPLYNLVTRRILGTRDGEERRPSSGPWPRWTEPVGRDAPRQRGD